MMDRRQDPDAMNVSTIRKLPRLAIRAAAAGAFLLGALAYAWWAFTGAATERAKSVVESGRAGLTR